MNGFAKFSSAKQYMFVNLIIILNAVPDLFFVIIHVKKLNVLGRADTAKLPLLAERFRFYLTGLTPKKLFSKTGPKLLCSSTTQIIRNGGRTYGRITWHALLTMQYALDA